MKIPDEVECPFCHKWGPWKLKDSSFAAQGIPAQGYRHDHGLPVTCCCGERFKVGNVYPSLVEADWEGV